MDPWISTVPWNVPPQQFPWHASGTAHTHSAQREKQPGLLSCLSFNWSDKPTRPRYFRDETVLLSVARLWVGKVCTSSPPRASAPATPAVPGLDSSRGGSANHTGCAKHRLCDVGRCLQRTRAKPNQHLLWPKPERNLESKSVPRGKPGESHPDPSHPPPSPLCLYHTEGAGPIKEARSAL